MKITSRMFLVLCSSFLWRFQSLETDTPDCIQPGVLKTKGLTTSGSKNRAFYNQGSYNKGFL